MNGSETSDKTELNGLDLLSNNPFGETECDRLPSDVLTTLKVIWILYAYLISANIFQGSWSTRPIPNSPKNQLAQFWSTRPKINSPNYQLAQIWSTRPIFSKCHWSTRPKPLVNSPIFFYQLAQI